MDPWETIYDDSGKLKANYERLGGTYARRSKCQSKIPNMTIGDVRQAFVQLRMLSQQTQLTPDTVLFNGMTAGRFSIEYIVRNYNNSSSKKKQASS